jgi:glycosyltransferase involved in cell wall biosynthesis
MAIKRESKESDTAGTECPPQPLVTVVLAVYNRKHLIERAIRSVREQTVSSWELLVVDDGSTDGLEDLVIPLVLQSGSIRYMKHQNRKLAATRNMGIQAALGTYVTFLDSDDAYAPDHLERRIEVMRAHPEIDFLHGGVKLIGPAHTHFVQDAYDPTQMIHISDCVVGGTLFGKKRAFVESGGFKQVPYSSESEFVPRVARTYVVKRVDFPTYRYYTGIEDSICSRIKGGKTLRF